MKWRVSYSKQALKYLKEKGLIQDAKNEISKFLRKIIYVEDLNVDVKKLKGKWKGRYRIKIREHRIVVEIRKDLKEIYIERVGLRKEIYKT